MNSEKENLQFPKVSVIVPIYNVDKYLRKCIESIINQTYTNLEIILIDDGATDSSRFICDEYCDMDPRITVIHKQNGGLVSARKEGIKRATGKYSMYVDGDDWIEVDMIETMVTESIQYEADIVVSGICRDYTYYTIEEMNHIKEGFYEGINKRSEIDEKLIYFDKFYMEGINEGAVDKLYKTELLRKNQMKVDDTIVIGEDVAVVFPCILEAKRVVVLRKCFYHYIIRNNSLMGEETSEKIENYKKLYLHLLNGIVDCERTEIIRQQINAMLLYRLLFKLPEYIFSVNECGDILPFRNLKKGEKAIIYGAGRFGQTLVSYFKKKNMVSIVAIMDKKPQEGVNSIDELCSFPAENYDKIVIAALKYEIAEDMVKILRRLQIDEGKIARIEYVSDYFYSLERAFNN